MNYLIHKIDRKSLVEGRTSGIAMGLAKKRIILKNVTYRLKTGMSTCKDYLNDVCAVENSDFEGGTVYKFKYTKGEFKIKKRNHLVVRSESYTHVITEEDLKKHSYVHDRSYHQAKTFNYSENIESAKFLINRIEKEIFKFKNDELTTISKIEDYISNDDKFLKDPLLIFDFSYKWMNNQINMSMFSGIVRRAICIKEFSEDEKNLSILDFIKMISKKPNLSEGFELDYFIENSIEDILLIFNSNLKELPNFLNSSRVNPTVHNFGLASLSAKIKEHSFDYILTKLNLKPANDTVTV